MIWEMRSLKPRLKRVETWFQSEMNWENDLWLKCRFHEFDDFECGSAVLLWAGMAVYDYEYWLVLDWTVSRNGCVWYEYWLVLDWTVSRMAEMDVDPWMRLNAYLCWIIDKCECCTSTIGDEGFPGRKQWLATTCSRLRLKALLTLCRKCGRALWKARMSSPP